MADVADIAKQSDHPWIPKWTKQKALAFIKLHGEKKFVEEFPKREKIIRAEREDPYTFGFEPPEWKDADKMLEEYDELFISGGNRSSKSEYCGKKIMKFLCEKGNRTAWCFHTTNQTSIQLQQPILWRYMPVNWKNMKQGRVKNISYSAKNGFTGPGNSCLFILPNGSRCIFFNYKQDKDVIEGGEPHIIWTDELVTTDWLDGLRFRAVTNHAKMIVSFTPVTGYTPTVKQFLSGGKVLESREAELLNPKVVHVKGCRKGHMPYKMQGRKKNMGCIWFFTKINRYSSYEKLVEKLEGQTEGDIKIRAYGWADNTVGNAFPKFTDDANVIDAEKIPAEGTNYMAIDPTMGSRNWSMVWMRVDRLGRRYIYREWPDSRYGEWAIPGEKADGLPGPAQFNGAGRGVNDYKHIIKELESEEIEYRVIDPRGGSQQTAAKEHGTSVIDLLAEDDPQYGPLYVTPASGVDIKDGVQIVNDWISYDTKHPITVLNEPKFYVSSECRNTIYCMKEWTGADGDKGATKDMVDCVRYLAVERVPYIDKTEPMVVGGSGGY